MQRGEKDRAKFGRSSPRRFIRIVRPPWTTLGNWECERSSTSLVAYVKFQGEELRGLAGARECE